MNKFFISLMACCLFSLHVVNAYAVSEAEYKKASLYAFIMGRAMGCGINVEDKAQSLENWVKRTFPSGEINGILGGILLISSEQMQKQKNGSTGEPCSTIRDIFDKMPKM